MNMQFLGWEMDAHGVLQAMFSGFGRNFASDRAELMGLFGRLFNRDWLAAMEAALTSHPHFSLHFAEGGPLQRHQMVSR